MALQKCVECGREISTDTATCPHCGKVAPTVGFVDIAKAAETRRNVAALIVVTILIVVGGILYQSCENSNERERLHQQYRREMYQR